MFLSLAVTICSEILEFTIHERLSGVFDETTDACTAIELSSIRRVVLCRVELKITIAGPHAIVCVVAIWSGS